MNVADELLCDRSTVIACSIEAPTIIHTTGCFLLESFSVLSCRLMASQDATDNRVGEGLTLEARSLPALIPHQPRTFQFPKGLFGKKV